MKFQLILTIFTVILELSIGHGQDRCRIQRARNAIFKRLGDVLVETTDGNIVKTFYISRILQVTYFPLNLNLI
jgi:hypothetical protein